MPLLTVAAAFYDDSTEVRSISETVSDPPGALLFAAATDQEFTSVVITVPVNSVGFAMAEPRYEVAPPMASLGLTQTANPTQQLPTQNVTYTLTLTNAADAVDAVGTVVTDVLPAGMTFQSETDPGNPWRSDDADGRQRWNCDVAMAHSRQVRPPFTITAQVVPNLVRHRAEQQRVGNRRQRTPNGAAGEARPVRSGNDSGHHKDSVGEPGIQERTSPIGLTNTGEPFRRGAPGFPAGDRRASRWRQLQSETDPGLPWFVTTPSVSSGGTVTFKTRFPHAR